MNKCGECGHEQTHEEHEKYQDRCACCGYCMTEDLLGCEYCQRDRKKCEIETFMPGCSGDCKTCDTPIC